MRLLCSLLLLACVGANAAEPAATPPTLPAPPKLDVPLPDTSITTTAPPDVVPPNSTVEEVTVEAPEPRYAAPTRRDRIGRVWAPVAINGKGPFRLVLDTGATGAAIIRSVADRLGISTANAKMIRLHGVTGSAMVPTIKVDTLEVGDLLLEGRRLPIVADAFGGAEGVLGTEGLADKRIYIDFVHDAISITRSKRQPASPDFASIPLVMGRDRLLRMEIMIGSVRTIAILDTGAQLTVGNHALRDLLKRRRSEELKTAEVIGVTLDVAQGQLMSVPTIHMGSSIQVRGLKLTFGDMFIFEQWKLSHEPAVLIGMDIIGSFEALVIDYKKKELQIRAKRG